MLGADLELQPGIHVLGFQTGEASRPGSAAIAEIRGPFEAGHVYNLLSLRDAGKPPGWRPLIEDISDPEDPIAGRIRDMGLRKRRDLGTWGWSGSEVPE
jgi:hypothetical protein